MDTNTPTPMKPIEIFRPGSFVASDGQRHTFTAAQVKELADTYNPAFSDAPLVVGHPKLTSPRFGRADKLFVNAAGVLCAGVADVVPEFAAAVAARHYPHVSASIYLPGAPGNPTPGKHYLRHIGFLGGAAPAVKGLAAVEFSGDETGVVSFSYEDRLISQLFRNLREWFIATAGTDKADQVLPSATVDAIAEAAMCADDCADDCAASPVPDFSTPTQPTEADLSQQKALDEQAAALALQKKELDGREAAIANQEAALRKTGHADFAEALCVTGQLLPAQKATVVEIMSQLDGINQIADFAAGDPNHGKTGADLFRAFLATQPKQVEFKRISPTTGGADAGGGVDFASPPGSEVHAESMDLYRLATQYQRDHPGVDICDAAKAVAK